MIPSVFRLRLPLLLLLAAGLSFSGGACGDDATAPSPPPPQRGAVEVGVVVNSVDLTLSVFPVDSPRSVTTVELGPDGSPVGVALREGIAAVPMGIVPALKVVDLAAGEVVRTVTLPDGSGATGVAFADDEVAVVANPGRNSVSPVDVGTGVVGEEIPVGTFPQAIVPVADRLFVLNAELGPDFSPTGPGTITVLSRTSLQVVGDVELSGENPGGGAVGPDGRLYVVNGGRFGRATGSLSVVDPVVLTEVAHHEGFGEFPGAPAVGPRGLLYVPSFAFGVAVWDPAAGAFARPPDDAVAAGGVPSAAGVGFDDSGRLHVLSPVCTGPAAVYRLGPGFEVEIEIPVGSCPARVAFGARGG